MFVYVCFQVQELGLQKAYSEDDAVYKYVRKLMALPFLPHRQISPMFVRLQVEAETEPLQNLVAYIRRQWIESTVFLPRNWSVYQQRGKTYSRNHQACVGKETEAGPAKTVPESAGEAI